MGIVNSLCVREDMAAIAASSGSSPTFTWDGTSPRPGNIGRIAVADVWCPQAGGLQERVDVLETEMAMVKAELAAVELPVLIRAAARECHRIVLERYAKARKRQPIATPAVDGGKPRRVEWLDVAIRVLRADEGDAAANDLDAFATAAGLTQPYRVATTELRAVFRNEVAHPDVNSVALSDLKRAAQDFPLDEYKTEANDAVTLFIQLRGTCA